MFFGAILLNVHFSRDSVCHSSGLTIIVPSTNHAVGLTVIQLDDYSSPPLRGLDNSVVVFCTAGTSHRTLTICRSD